MLATALLLLHLSLFLPIACFDDVTQREKRYGLLAIVLRRYIVIRKKRWDRNKISWRFDRKLVTDGDVFIVRNILHRAFNEWASVCDLLVEEVKEGDSDIIISFEKGHHRDAYPFDGPDGIVAHAFYPRDGRLHFDADEQWTLNEADGVNLFQTAVHEIGHLLGLEHSTDPRAVMFAAKRPYSPLFSLSDDDVRAIRLLFPHRPRVRGVGIFSPSSTFFGSHIDIESTNGIDTSN